MTMMDGTILHLTSAAPNQWAVYVEAASPTGYSRLPVVAWALVEDGGVKSFRAIVSSTRGMEFANEISGFFRFRFGDHLAGLSLEPDPGPDAKPRAV